MLATAPAPLEAPVDWCGRRFEPASTSAASNPRGWTLPGCPVCGSKRVVGDEVAQLGTLRLSECLHCDHRWTQRGPDRWAEVGASMKRVPRPGSMRTVAPIRRRPVVAGDPDSENPS